jgi:hypothetical protein
MKSTFEIHAPTRIDADRESTLIFPLYCRAWFIKKKKVLSAFAKSTFVAL